MSAKNVMAPILDWAKSGLMIVPPTPKAIDPRRDAVGVACACDQVDILRTQAKQPIRVCRFNWCLLISETCAVSFSCETNWPQAVEQRGAVFSDIIG